jgi:hypothetical protein
MGVKPILVLALLLFLIPSGLAAAPGASPAIAGSWDCVANDEHGTQTSWVLTIRQSGAQLAGSLRSATTDDEMQLLEPLLDGNKLGFKVRINATEIVKIALTNEGDRMEGTFAGKDSGRGTFRATRAVDVSGKWSGEWEVGPDGAPGPHYMILKQDGAKVTGTAGPRPDYQMAIQKGGVAGGRLTFEVGVADTLALRFSFTVTGDSMHGEAVLAMNGTEQKLKLEATRVGQ